MVDSVLSKPRLLTVKPKTYSPRVSVVNVGLATLLDDRAGALPAGEDTILQLYVKTPVPVADTLALPSSGNADIILTLWFVPAYAVGTSGGDVFDNTATWHISKNPPSFDGDEDQHIGIIINCKSPDIKAVVPY
ncbi:MAG: hypothetical protein J0665_20170, partial [Deltaproteobacteria bacterium]|nr:hypothetical protein [Deltaproteobacteria bacterium]